MFPSFRGQPGKPIMTSIDWNLEFSPEKGSQTEKKNSALGLVAAATTGGLAVGLMAICGPFVLPGFRRICLPYVPATDNQVSNVLRILKGRSCKSIVDLGSGDGRIVYALAENRKTLGGTEFVGVELNTWLVLYSKLVALRRFGREANVRFLRKDIWKYDLGNHDTVVVFGVECMMKELQLKSEKELKKGSTVVACRFPFETWIPTKVEGDGVDTVWLYQR
ncbi:protein N-lysine methyltransferase FAM173B [Galendromus occidentalis]|uniref:Protein N-lysine methyltransferase FAM173B n=1 Tax=Galendromus occidentalis TaxID=34638 RepID=A0AAJ6QM64_9ACAR|nr:protein N-lysine methyltransferase FAM173B [Galendromus occidentalis]